MTKLSGVITSEVSLKLKSSVVLEESKNESRFQSRKFLPDLRKADT